MNVAYLAGFIDGDGSISIFRKIIRPNQKKYKDFAIPYCYLMRLRIGNTHRGVLEIIKREFGGHVCQQYGYHVRGNRKICYSWSVEGISAKRILERIVDMLIIKKEGAELALKFQQHKEKMDRKMDVKEELKNFWRRNTNFIS